MKKNKKKIKLLKALAFPVSAWFMFNVGAMVVNAEEVQPTEQTVETQTDVNSVQATSLETTDTTTDDTVDVIYDGTYTIESALNKSLDAENAGTGNGTNVQSYEVNGSNAQLWSITTNSDGTKTILNLNSGQALDANNGQAYNGNNVQLYETNGSNAQKWYLVNNGQGYYTIQSAINKNYVLDIDAGRTTNGTNVQLWKSNGSMAQLWKLTYVSKVGNLKQDELKKLEGKVNVTSASNSNYVLDISGGKTTNGTNIQLYSNNLSSAQVWNLSVDDDGYVTFTSDKTNSVIDLSAGRTTNGQNIHLWKGDGNKAQKWVLIKNGSTYEIRSAYNLSYGLDINNGTIGNSTNIQLYKANGTNAQKWNLSKFQSAYELGGMTKEEIEEIPSVVIISSSKENGFVLDLDAGTLRDCGNVQLYQSNGSKAQGWKFEFNEYGYLTISNLNSGKVLDVNNGSFRNGSNIQQYSSNGTMAQKWYLEKTDNGYVIHSKGNGNYVLDLDGGVLSNKRNIQLYESNGSKPQAWNFTEYKTGKVVTTPEEQHQYVEQFEVVHHDAEYKTEYVVDQEAYDEQKPIYKYESHNFCWDCDLDLHGMDSKVLDDHLTEHLLNGGVGGYRSKTVKVLSGYETIHHDEVGHNEQVLVKEAYDETISKGFKCSRCGTNK